VCCHCQLGFPAEDSAKAGGMKLLQKLSGGLVRLPAAKQAGCEHWTKPAYAKASAGEGGE